MAPVSLSGIAKSFGGAPVLSDISLDIAQGEFVVFVGPSGCGKSTLLRIVAGLEEADRGTVSIGGQPVNGLAPAKRGIAMVFQSYALYPHMSVRENMGFALKLAGKSKAETGAAVMEAARILDIEALLERRPAALSGGQRQRVAIGRAIVRRPKVFLFDEPLSNLDAGLRGSMRLELSRLHQRLQATMLYVTHDQVEAMTLADRVVVLSAGRIEQAGAPMALYDAPANLFVAGFIGAPKMNFLDAALIAATAGGARLRLRGGSVITVPADARGCPAGAALTLGIRPEHVRLGPAVGGDGPAGTVAFIEALGNISYAHVAFAGGPQPLICQIAEPGGLRPGAVQSIGFDPGRCHLFGADGKALPACHLPGPVSA